MVVKIMMEAQPPQTDVIKVIVVNVPSLTLVTRGKHLNIEQMVRGRTVNHLMIGATPNLATRHQAGNWKKGELINERLDCHDIVESVQSVNAVMVDAAIGLQLENMEP